MNYNRMFNLLFSDVITEDVKDLVIEKVRGSINECAEETSPCAVFLSTLVYESNISEEALNDVIDMVTEGMSEEEIERIAEEFERAAVVAVLEWGPAPVGLTGVRKAAEQKQPSQPTAKDRLKSAVGKVKAWAGNVASKVKTAVNQPTGFDKMKQTRAERIQKAVEMGTGPKTEKAQEAPKEEPKETPKPAPVREEPKETPKPAPVLKRVPRKTVSKTKSTAKKAASKAKSAGKKVAKIIKDAETPKELVPAKRGRKKVNEALEDAITLIAATNISGSSLVEIVEMISNKKVAEKAVEKEYQEFTKAANALNKAEEISAKTGVPVDPEVKEKLAKQAEEKGERYEHVKALADKKFGE